MIDKFIENNIKIYLKTRNYNKIINNIILYSIIHNINYDELFHYTLDKIGLFIIMNYI